MVSRKEIYIKLDEITEIVDTLKEIKEQEDLIRQLFKDYDALKIKETKILEDWGSNLEEVNSVATALSAFKT